MKIVTCASYYSSGSSAVTDLLSEYSCVKAITDSELRFVHDPDGISELEFNLVENFNRHNSGHALKRFKRLVDYYGDHYLVRRYEPIFNNKWKQISYEYIDSLICFKYLGYWDYDFYDRGNLFEFWRKLPIRIMRRTLWRYKPDKQLNLLPKEVTFASHPSEKMFLECTKRYTTKLFEAANPELKPIILTDQILPSTNIKRHMRYFDDNIQCIIVDRDPRDIYLFSKYENDDKIVPHDINLFCEWYLYARTTRDEELFDTKKVILVQFEDLVYKYEETKNKIINWIGIEESSHLYKNKFFNPYVSKKNTRYWIQHPECTEEANEISKRLPNFLYHLD